MPPRSSDPTIDRLYQLIPADFTGERNALAKESGGEEGKRIRGLPKPSMSAWAVNQLHWRDRDTYDVLVAASERLRAAHRAVLGGRKADLAGADAAHRDAMKRALVSTLRLAKDAGQTISPATHTEIAQTLESLSADDHAGRLAKPLRPEGFQALQGMTIRGKAAAALTAETTSRPQKVAQERTRKEAQRDLQAARDRERRDQAAVARLRKQIAAAARETARAKSALNRAQAREAELSGELRQAEETLERNAKARRDLERASSS